jgi:hypothetical protein
VTKVGEKITKLVKQGHGTLINTKDGTSYIGNWENDQKSGKGKVTF